MPSLSQAVLLSWSIPPAASFALALTAVIYLRGWRLMRRAGVPFVPAWRAICFFLGLLTVWIALASPLDTFSAFLITAHMLQHMLLMMVAPPLILLGSPLIPLVRGLPVFAAREFAGPFVRWRFAVGVGRALTNLWVALVLMGLAMFVWHTPRLYELALASGSWHEFEHACFFVASLIFWWPIVQPWPSRAQAPRWAVVPYLLIADLQNTVLSAILVFSDRVLYPSYSKMPRLFGLSATQDQAASGAIMWVMGSLVFVVPAVVIAMQCLSSGTAGRELAIALKPVRSSWSLGVRPLAAAREWLKQRFGARGFEAITFVVLFAAAGLSLSALASGRSDDDDQALRVRETSGPFTISIFSAPGNLEPGSNSFSALVQDVETQRVLQNVNVAFAASPADASREASAVRADAADSENKLLQSADVDLPTPGNWSLLVTVQRGAEQAEFSLPVKVVEPAARFDVRWPYLVLFAFAAVLVFAYLRRRRRTWRRVRGSSAPVAGQDELELTHRAL